MKIKYLIMTMAASVMCCSALKAQTAEEIVERMSAQMEGIDAKGYTMDLVMKMPIVGEMRSHNIVRGDWVRTEIKGKEKDQTIWTDAATQWTYDHSTGEITITQKPQTDASAGQNSDLSAFDSITIGYDLVLENETSDAWYILCKKKKSNKDKDDPKTMDLAVKKATYLPQYMRMKKSVISVSIENVTVGVPVESAAFNPADYPNAKIIDKR